MDQKGINTNKLIELKLDTGSDINIISNVIYNFLNPKPKLIKTNFKIEAYGGSKIKSIGQIKVNCSIEGLNGFLVDLVVVVNESKDNKFLS